MYLSRSAEYALRTMAHLARRDSEDRVTATELARATEAPGPFLSKILRRLTSAGLLSSQKGHHGGFCLAAQPEEIRFLDILRAVEFGAGADHCLFGWDSCGEDDPCPLHPDWAALKESIEEWASSRSLADITQRHVSAERAREVVRIGRD